MSIYGSVLKCSLYTPVDLIKEFVFNIKKLTGFCIVKKCELFFIVYCIKSSNEIIHLSSKYQLLYSISINCFKIKFYNFLQWWTLWYLLHNGMKDNPKEHVFIYMHLNFHYTFVYRGFFRYVVRNCSSFEKLNVFVYRTLHCIQTSLMLYNVLQNVSMYAYFCLFPCCFLLTSWHTWKCKSPLKKQ